MWELSGTIKHPLRGCIWNDCQSPLHKRALRFVYFDYKSSFNELLDNDDSFRIYHKNGKGLANRIYKCLYSLSPAT